MKTDLPLPWPDEEWIEVYGHPRYLVSTYGRFYCPERAQLLRDYMTSGPPPRRRVTLYDVDGGPPRAAAVAVEVLAAFSPARGPRRGHVPEFLDGDPANCRLDNLRWVLRNSAEHRAAMERERQRTRGAEPSPAAPAPEVEERPPPSQRRPIEPGIPSPEGVQAALAEFKAPVRVARSTEERDAIRRWAAEQGISCSPRGRIALDLLRAFDRVRGELAVSS